MEDIIREALKVYGIAGKYVFSSGIDKATGEAIILTNGGKKFRHRKGEPAKFELSHVQITGELPEQEFVWDAKLNQRIELNALIRRHKKVIKKLVKKIL